MGLPEQEIVVTGTVSGVDGDRVLVETEAAQGENRDHPQGRGRAPSSATDLRGVGAAF